MSETTIKTYRQAKSISRSREVNVLVRSLLAPLLIITIVTVLWLVSLVNINPRNMNDLGLVSVLPITYYVAIGILAISFIVNVHQKDSHEFVLLLHILLLIFMIHATPQIAYGTLRYSWAWKHVGIVDYIQRNGSVDPTINDLNAYHNWPGFFALAAMYNTVAGLATSLGYAGWGPLFFNLVDLGALLLLFRSFTKDNRLVWLSLWIYYICSWVGQDYFSPQAFSYFLFLVTIAVVVRWFRRQPVPSPVVVNPIKRSNRLISRYYSIINHVHPDGQQISESTAPQRLFLMILLIMIFFVIASSHQLTPLMLVSGLALLVIFQVTNQKYIPILLLTITAAWIIYMAVGFLDGNLYWIIRSIGSLLENLNTNVNLATSSPGQTVIANVDRFLSIFVWVLGILGFYRLYLSRKWNLPVVLLALAPLPMLAMNSYGGEMIFRVYMFSLPFVSFLAGSLFYTHLNAGSSIKTPFITALLNCILIPAFLLSYYGKERMNYFSPQEVATSQFIFTNSPQGSLIVDGVFDWPRQYTHYEDYSYFWLSLLPPDQINAILQNPAQELPSYMEIAGPGAQSVVRSTVSPKPDSETSVVPGVKTGKVDYPASYLVITRSQIAEAEMTGVLPANWSGIIISSLSHSPNFKVVYSNADAVVFQYFDPTEP